MGSPWARQRGSAVRNGMAPGPWGTKRGFLAGRPFVLEPAGLGWGRGALPRRRGRGGEGAGGRARGGGCGWADRGGVRGRSVGALNGPGGEGQPQRRSEGRRAPRRARPRCERRRPAERPRGKCGAAMGTAGWAKGPGAAAGLVQRRHGGGARGRCRGGGGAIAVPGPQWRWWRRCDCGPGVAKAVAAVAAVAGQPPARLALTSLRGEGPMLGDPGGRSGCVSCGELVPPLVQKGRPQPWERVPVLLFGSWILHHMVPAVEG